MKKQQGFAALEAILMLVAIAIVGFTGYYVWHARQDTNKVLGQTQAIAAGKQSQSTKVTTKQLIQYSDEASALVKKAYDVFAASMVKHNNTSYAISDLHPYLVDSLYVSLNENSVAKDPVFCTDDMSVPQKIDVVSVVPSASVIGVQVDTGRADQRLIDVNVDHHLNKIISIQCPGT
jgi:hypothetical protein